MIIFFTYNKKVQGVSKMEKEKVRKKAPIVQKIWMVYEGRQFMLKCYKINYNFVSLVLVIHFFSVHSMIFSYLLEINCTKCPKKTLLSELTSFSLRSVFFGTPCKHFYFSWSCSKSAHFT